MKTLIFVILVTAYLGVSGCGNSTSADFDRWEFYSEMYAGCTKMCELCDSWFTNCAKEIPSNFILECTNYHWDLGGTNDGCIQNTEHIKEWIEQNQCYEDLNIEQNEGHFCWRVLTE